MVGNIGIGIANAIGFNKIKKGGTSSLKPIASYRSYDKTNDDEDRAVMKDLTGNGHDIQLYNFEFTEESGYNKSTYKGALVSDGVDDYGLCENFPDLPIDKGFTVCAIRMWINKLPSINAVFISNRTTDNNRLVWGPFNIDKINVINGVATGLAMLSYGTSNGLKLTDINSNFFAATSTSYNGKDINKGDNNSQYNILNLFCGIYKGGEYSSIALYALEIYDRDLTDEEIAKVKVRMIAEYEERTGNKYEEEKV